MAMIVLNIMNWDENRNEHGVKFFKEETPENLETLTHTYILREGSENWFGGSNEATCSMDLASCK